MLPFILRFTMPFAIEPFSSWCTNASDISQYNECSNRDPSTRGFVHKRYKIPLLPQLSIGHVHPGSEVAFYHVSSIDVQLIESRTAQADIYILIAGWPLMQVIVAQPEVTFIPGCASAQLDPDSRRRLCGSCDPFGRFPILIPIVANMYAKLEYIR